MIKMTEGTARALGLDAANAQMRKAGRKVWNREDYHLAMETFRRHWPDPFETDPTQQAYRQWQRFKSEKDREPCILLIKMGDFYEAFDEDAQRLRDYCAVALTVKHGLKLAGIPVSSIERYRWPIKKAGFNLALEDYEIGAQL